MGKRQRRWAVKARLRLIERLGGVCVECGSKVDLEIDHPAGISYDASALESSQRVSRYRQEAKQGIVRLLCAACNKKFRPGRKHYDVPEENCPF